MEPMTCREIRDRINNDVDQNGDADGVLDDGHFVIAISQPCLIKEDVIYVDFGTHGSVKCIFDRFEGKSAVVHRWGENEEHTVDLSDVYLGEYDERSISILLAGK